MFEVEKRALITDKKVDEITSFLCKKGKFISKFKRFTMVNIKNQDFSPSLDNNIDLKVRVSKDDAKYTVKTGNWHKDSSRSEYDVKFDSKDIKNLFHILVAQGYLFFLVMYISRLQYIYKGLVITIDKNYFSSEQLIEVEMTTNNENEVKKIEMEIDEFLTIFNLNSLNSEETVNYIKSLNMNERTQIDFSKISVEKWFKKWNEYIYTKA